MFDDAAIKFMLILIAVIILGAVVIPRLAGWVFHPTNASFFYVLIAIIVGLAVWQRNNLTKLIAENKPFVIGIGIVVAVIVALALAAKDKSVKARKQSEKERKQ